MTGLRALLCVMLLVAVFGSTADAASGASRTITGNVKRVLDGDSLILRAEGLDVEVRLAEIDAPEKGQPYADNSRKALQGMVLGRRVRAEVLDVDRYGRSVCRIYRLPDETWVNAEMVRRGHAWVYSRYVRDPALYDIEREARERRAGLWVLPVAEREPPWQWRHEHPPIHAEHARAH